MTARHVIPPVGVHEETVDCPCWPTVLNMPDGVARVIHHEPGGKPAEPIRLDDYRPNKTIEGGRDAR